MIEHNPLYQLTMTRLREFLREPEAVFWVFIFPAILAVALGLAFRNQPTEVVQIFVTDGEGAEELATSLDASQDLAASVVSVDDARQALRTGRVPLIVLPTAPITLQYDSTREESRLARLLTDQAIQRAAGQEPIVPLQEIRSAEPGARYIDFLIPGLLGMNIMGTGMWGIGFGIAQMRQRKLLKRLIASPMRKSHFLWSQILFRLVFLAIEVAFLVGFGALVLGVPVRGNLVTLGLVSAMGGMVFAGLGLLAASRAQTIEGTSGILNFVMMPMWILSGVFFSYALFPEVLHPFIQALPLTALNDALRAVMLEGAGLSGVLAPIGVMAAWCAVSFGVALKIFRWV